MAQITLNTEDLEVLLAAGYRRNREAVLDVLNAVRQANGKNPASSEQVVNPHSGERDTAVERLKSALQ